MNKRITMRNGLRVGGLLILLGVSVAAYGYSRAAEGSDCPGKVICPITGKEVCKDECPLVDSSRGDCPGRIECPLTGELVCRDQCPLGVSADESASKDGLPSCCRKSN